MMTSPKKLFTKSAFKVALECPARLSAGFPSSGIADECSFDGRPWMAPMRRVPCEFAGHPFEILCGDARDNKARLDCCAVPPEGVIGFDFFNNFTLVVDRLGGKKTFVKS